MFDLSIIIVTYNNLKYTKECITELKKYSNSSYEIIMVDNGSSDETVEYIKSVANKYILNDKNEGFAKAVNQGLALADSKYICLLNNDLLVYYNWDRELIERFEKLSTKYKVGAIAPVGSGIGNKQDYVTFFGEHGFHFPYTDNYYIFNEGNKIYRKGNYIETKYLSGCCLLMKTELLKGLNGLDEGCVCGADDADLSLTLRTKGYSLFVVDDVFVYHYNHKTFGLIGHDEEMELYNKSWDYFCWKWAYLNVGIDVMLYTEDKFYYNGITNRKLNV